MYRLNRNENGQIVALFAMSMVVLLSFLAIAVDVGWLWTERRQMQTAADAAAVAAALALRDGDNVSTAGKNASTLNSFSDGLNNVIVTINNPPASGPYAANNSYVEAIVDQPQTTFFLRALGYNAVDVSARAVSGSVSGPDCIYSLDPTDSNAFVASGGTDITSLCGLFVDSSSTNGLVVSGGSTVNFSGGIGVVASTETEAPGVAYTAGVAPVGDPLANVPEPAVGACTASTSSGHGYSASGGETISQGTYCGGISVGGGKTLNLNPGTYILLGGGLQVSGSSNLIGSGVTFFNTLWMSGDPSADHVGNSNQYKTISFSGGSATSLTAPSNGSLQGILFFQDRNLPSRDTGASASQNTISGGSSAVLTGALYFPSTPLVFSGGSSAQPIGAILIGYTVTISGGTTLSSNFASIGGSPVKSETLYE